MSKTLPRAGTLKRTHRTLFAAAALIAAVAATTLTACGPRDETALAGGGSTGVPAPTTNGQPVPMAQPMTPAQTQLAAAAPAPAYVPPSPAAVAPQPVLATSPTYPAAPPRVQSHPGATPVAPPVRPAPSVQVGSITSIEPIKERPQGTGTGAVVGGVLGAVVGNQFGHGLGRAAMTGVGAAGGAIAGNNVERNYKTAVVGYRVNIRLDNGHTRTFQRTSLGNLHVGDRVRVDANGFRRS